MHATLEQVRNDLVSLAQTIKSAAGTDMRPLYQINNNNVTVAAIDREELAERAEALANDIDAYNCDELSETEQARLNKYPERLQFLRSNTSANFVNSHAASTIPAYILTLDTLDRTLRAIFARNKEEIGETTRAARKLRDKVRGLTVSCEQLEPKVATLQQMAVDIVAAHEAADQLPTDLQLLREARGEIEQLLSDAKGNREQVYAILLSSRGAESSLVEKAREAERVIKQCEDAMRASTAVGLAGAFHDRAEELGKSIRPWVAGLGAALCAGALIGAVQLQHLSEAILSSTSPTIVITRLIVSLLSVGAPVWFAWLATKQIGQRFRLAEDYAYKASISRAYEGYRREAAVLDEDFQKQLFASALLRLDEQPLRFVEHETHGSPWHELFSSDTFKEALRIAPELLGQFKNIAQQTVSDAKARRRGRAEKPENANIVKPDA